MSLARGSARLRPRVLLIDDSPTVLAAVSQVLGANGFDTHTVTDPSALSLGEARQADLVVVDVHMLEVFGDDVVSFMREQWGVSVPFVMYSSTPAEELRARASRVGAAAAVSKQEGPLSLVRTLNTLAGRAP